MTQYSKTKKRVLTRRGVIWLGQTCNLRCHFCYFMDRIAATSHPEHPFMSLDKAKRICSFLVDYYQNNAIDIQGGEPTIYPHINELVRYCREIGLLPTLITNAIALDKIETCKRLKDSGMRDCLVSVHGLGDTYDAIVGVPFAHRRQLAGLINLQKLDIPVRFNCVLSKMALPQLKEIAELAIARNVLVVNFIAFNPFEDQQKSGKRSDDNVPRYDEVLPYLTEALDILDAAGTEANVRYFPICMLEDRHRKSGYNFQQLPYDIHEWDYASWSWTGLQSQRMRDGNITAVVSLEEASIRPVQYPGPLNRLAGSVKRCLEPYPALLNLAVSANRKISAASIKRKNTPNILDDKEWLYRENARIRARDHCKYIYGEGCMRCDAQNICDGFHGDYACLFGTDEARPIQLGDPITDPKFYISRQEKIVEHEDFEWAL